jgi:hypothetical protein
MAARGGDSRQNLRWSTLSATSRWGFWIKKERITPKGEPKLEKKKRKAIQF